jgi:hypothetical protein
LLSRIKDKKGSQKTLIKELGELIDDENAESLLIKNSDLLVENLQTLTDVVRQQIGVRKRLEQHIEALHRMARSLSKTNEYDKQAIRIVQLTNTNIFKVLNILLDPNRARFSRSKRELAAGIEELNQFSFKNEPLSPELAENPMQTVEEFKQYWATKKDRVYRDKGNQLANEFKIKALVEENSLIANRLLSSAKTEFWRASKELTSGIQQVVATARFTITIMCTVVMAFVTGSFFV